MAGNSDLVREGMTVYRIMLENTRDVFGRENMTSDAICAAIREAGSVVWMVMNSGDRSCGELVG